jgi:hypothetical protein
VAPTPTSGPRLPLTPLDICVRICQGVCAQWRVSVTMKTERVTLSISAPLERKVGLTCLSQTLKKGIFLFVCFLLSSFDYC